MTKIIQDVRYGVVVDDKLMTGHFCYAGQHSLERALDSMLTYFLNKYQGDVELVKYVVVDAGDDFETTVLKKMTVAEVLLEEPSDLQVLESSRQMIREWRETRGLAN